VKVLLVNTYHYIRGGDCTYTFGLAGLLREHGHSVRFFSMKHPKNFPSADEKYFVDYIDFVELNRKRTIMNGMRVLVRAIYSAQARKHIARLLDEMRPDIVHLQNLHTHITLSVIPEIRRRGIPIVWTLHDYKLICPNTHLMAHGRICEACKPHRYAQCTLRKCKKDSRSASLVSTLEAEAHRFLGYKKMVSAYLSPSAFLIDKFVEFGWGRERFVHLPLFLQPEHIYPDGGRDGGYALYMGRLESYKGLHTLLAAAGQLGNLPLKIVGEGSEEAEIRRTAEALALENVTFDGYKTGEDLRQRLRECSFVVVPSEWYENHPYSVMESMAAGKPVVAARIGGLPEMVEEGLTGLLFEPGNAAELAEKMRCLSSDKELRARMGRSAREKAVALYDRQRHYDALVNIYSRFTHNP
jgi:glycosyltransferase involved in cell wall biosynthesis